MSSSLSQRQNVIKNRKPPGQYRQGGFLLLSYKLESVFSRAAGESDIAVGISRWSQPGTVDGLGG